MNPFSGTQYRKQCKNERKERKKKEEKKLEQSCLETQRLPQEAKREQESNR
jgi:hypothetical protein